MLAPDLTVAENIFIDNLASGKRLINWKELNRSAKRLLEELGFGEINPTAKAGALSVAYQPGGGNLQIPVAQGQGADSR